MEDWLELFLSIIPMGLLLLMAISVPVIVVLLIFQVGIVGG